MGARTPLTQAPQGRRKRARADYRASLKSIPQAERLGERHLLRLMKWLMERHLLRLKWLVERHLLRLKWLIQLGQPRIEMADSAQ